MITLKEIQKEYLRRIPIKFAKPMEKYINEPIVQNYIDKALRYELTNSDYNWLAEHGMHGSSEYPHLYWLCAIYIHPLTQLQELANKCERLAQCITS